ncbi:MAG: FMN-binding protein [Desulfobacterales bacterium]|nr:FMN-binding protein [Desulfobacterales bacterium]
MQSKFIVILLSIFLLFGCSTTAESGRSRNVNISDEIEKIKSMDISYVDPATVSDGEYIGEFPFRQKYLYQVRVTVESGRITDIEVLENGTGNEYAEKGLGVIQRILEDQSPDVDAVSGATVTSKALMKCVEKALKKARQINE